jgi:hypothetical protein
MAYMHLATGVSVAPHMCLVVCSKTQSTVAHILAATLRGSTLSGSSVYIAMQYLIGTLNKDCENGPMSPVAYVAQSG